MDLVTESGRYSLIRQIGGGSCGIVWAAQDKQLDRKVAIKKIHNLFRDNGIDRRTLRELRLLKHFKHENIISILDVIEPESRESYREIFVVCELMDANLHKIITSAQPLDDDAIQLFIYQILRGLKCLHSAGVLHRDLKPTNILVNSNCDLKICDLGCGRGGGNLERTGRASLKMTKLDNVQTRWYCAPEGLMSSCDYTTAVDVWSVGCILAELFGRRVLFQGKSTQDQLNVIFDILGTPSDEDIALIPTDEYREKVRSMQPVPRKCFKQLFPHASPLGLELMEAMLTFNPEKRITVTDALAHPYLAYYHDENDEPVAPGVFNELDQDVTTSIRDLLYDELVSGKQLP